MKVYDPKTLKYRDQLAEKRRKVFLFKTLFFIGSTVAATGFIFYLLFFSRLLDIKNISINGLDKADSRTFSGMLYKRLDSKWLGYVEKQKNIIFFSSNTFKAEILNTFPEIKKISVEKKMPDSLTVDVVERQTVGIWCIVAGCKYFDEEGVVWGEATRSSGYLILNVDDLRKDRKWSDKIGDEELLKSFDFVSEKLKEMNILVSRFVIPEDYIGDFKALTSKGYTLLFSLESDIKEQIENLQIFMAEKEKNPPLVGGFHPQYIDLRINGRVYYR